MNHNIISDLLRKRRAGKAYAMIELSSGPRLAEFIPCAPWHPSFVARIWEKEFARDYVYLPGWAYEQLTLEAHS